MTVQELVEVLLALPEEDRDKQVVYIYDKALTQVDVVWSREDNVRIV